MVLDKKRIIEVELIYVVEERFIVQYKRNSNSKMRLMEKTTGSVGNW